MHPGVWRNTKPDPSSSNETEEYLKTSFCIILWAVSTVVAAQKVKIDQAIRQADSIIAFSHWDAVFMIGENGAEDRAIPTFLPGDYLNPEMITERKKIAKDRFLTLSVRFNNVIRVKKGGSVVIDELGCYMPHHTLYIYKDGKRSWIDMCFTCGGYTSSGDLDYSDFSLNHNYTEPFITFFKAEGFQYWLTSDDGPEKMGTIVDLNAKR